MGNPGGGEATYFSLANSLAVASTPNGNPAAYGANLNFKGTYFNPNSNDAGTFYIGIRARNNGGKYFGVSIVDAAGSASDAANMLPIPQSHPNDNLKGYSIVEFYPHLVHLGFVYVPPQSGSLDYTVRVANAGACATPANIILSTDGVWPQPTGGGD